MRTTKLPRLHETMLIVFVFWIAWLLTPDLAHAAGAGGAMPWDRGIATFTQALTALGFALVILGLFVLGVMLVFSHEWGRFASSIVLVIVAGGCMIGGSALAGVFGYTGAVV